MKVRSNALLLVLVPLLVLAIARETIAFGPSGSGPCFSQDWSSFTIPVLKEQLKHHGCKVSGRKAELIERLEAVYTAQANDRDQQVRSSDLDIAFDSIFESKETDNLPVTLANKRSIPTGSQRNTLLKQQSCTVSGTKAELIQRLDTVRSTITTQSSQQPPSSTTDSGFTHKKIPREILQRLHDLGFTQPTPIQREAIPIALDGIDVMGLAQTGTGKTLAFGIPLVSNVLEEQRRTSSSSSSSSSTSSSSHTTTSRRSSTSSHTTTTRKHTSNTVSALVLAPTRELAIQIATELKSLTEETPIETYAVYGGAKVLSQINRLEKGGIHILVATPGRLVDLIHRQAVSLRDTKFLVLDESDMMLDMGFAPDLTKIANMIPSDRQTMLFSATMSQQMAKVAKRYLKHPVRVEVARSGRTADNITQEVHFIAKMNKLTKLLSLMKHHEAERTVIFGRTKHGMEKLSQRLNHAGVKAMSIHGNKSQSQREPAIQAFKSGEVKVLVATDVAARGLDIPEVKHVYNYELPDKAENYVHRIGRTARAGEEGASISFCSEEEMNDLKSIEELLGGSIPIASGSPWDNRGNVRRFRKDSSSRNKRQVRDHRMYRS